MIQQGAFAIMKLMDKTKKIIFTAIVVVVAIYAAGMIRVMLAQNSYKDPQYQAYKQKYLQCADTYDKTAAPDKIIYQAWVNGEEPTCD